MRERRKTVLVVGHYGGPNVGDEAMLLGLLFALRSAERTRFLVSTKDGTLSPALAAFQNVDVCTRGIVADVYRAARLRHVVLGGGTHFHDAFRGRRLGHQYLSLTRYLAICAAARLTGGTVLWLGMGFGPLTRRASRLFCAVATRLANRIVVRDESSLRLLTELNVNAVLGFDLAALMPGDTQEFDATSRVPITIGVAPTSLALHGEGSGGPEPYDPLASGIATLGVERPVRVTLFVFSGGGPDQDRTLVGKIARRWRERFGLDCEIADHPDDPQRVLAEIGCCDAMVAVRFHSLLLAFMAASPAVAISYHPKVAQLADELGLPPAGVLRAADIGRLEDGALLQAALEGHTAFRLSREDALRRAHLNVAAFSDVHRGSLPAGS